MLTILLAGCGDDAPDCNLPVLTNEQEAAVIRTALATTEGMVATAPDTTAAEIVAIASDFQAQHESHLVDPDPCDDFGPVLIVYQLMVADMIANSSTISPELAGGLTLAAREDGAGGLYTFLTRSQDYYSNEYPGLAEMRDRLREQRGRADGVFEDLGSTESSSSPE